MSETALPNHVAIVLDGNGRWAVARGLPRWRGHEHGAHAMRVAIDGCERRGIGHVTLYTFGVESWSRPKEEVDAIMRICAEFASGERAGLLERGVRVVTIGDVEELPSTTRRAVERLVNDTAAGAGMTLALAMNYGGRADVVNAMRALAVHARAGLVIPEEIDERSLRSFLSTGGLPDPDLVIRTGGERRLSDFLSFESAHAELFFTETLWPDFSEETLDEALRAFAQRRRRYDVAR